MLFWRGVSTGEFLDVAYDTRIIYMYNYTYVYRRG